MGRRKHKPWTGRAKRDAYKTRSSQPGYPKGGFGVPHAPYGKEKRND